MRIGAVFLVLFFIGCGGRSGDDGESARVSCAQIQGTDESLFPSYPFESDPRDPLMVYQWHLNNFGQRVGNYEASIAGGDINMPAQPQGRGVTIAIVDTGVDETHPDLSVNHNRYESWNYQKNSASPYPNVTDDECAHGTMVAGIAAAVGYNYQGVRGVAPNAYWAGLNIADKNASGGCALYIYPDALSARPDRHATIDIFSNSWGAELPRSRADLIPLLEAIQEGAESGRDNRGAIYVFAAGNGRAKGHNANYFGEQNSIYTISVAALNSDDRYSSYSNPGSNILISAYGGFDGYGSPGIVTTDISGCDKGMSTTNNPIMQHTLNRYGEYTHHMSGTSAATPMVSGAIALILEAKPDLTWRNVRYILATTARRNDPSDDDWRTNGAGWYINHNYGFGALDVKAAVQKARTFTSLGTLKKKSKTIQNINGAIANDANLTMPINVNEGENLCIEFVDFTIAMNIGGGRKNNISLISPDGTVSTLADGRYTTNASFYSDGRTFGSVRYLDELSNGEWKVKIENKSGASYNLTDANFTLTFYGRNYVGSCKQ
ncbi:MAG: S8 family serine peptidase [Helicobacteraceae bacterium]|jgi:subtilisin family serine protease|nr:S8 family serine peptidase [Helicobacteraceae bacterium]